MVFFTTVYNRGKEHEQNSYCTDCQLSLPIPPVETSVTAGVKYTLYLHVCLCDCVCEQAMNHSLCEDNSLRAQRGKGGKKNRGGSGENWNKEKPHDTQGEIYFFLAFL